MTTSTRKEIAKVVDPEIIGNNLDRLVTVEMRLGGMANGVLGHLYPAAREAQGGPLSLLAARKLADNVKKGDTVILLTGFVVPRFMPRGETDGPPGVAALARALHVGLGARPVFIVEEALVGPLAATCRVAGIDLVPMEEYIGVPYTAGLITVDVGVDGPAFAREVMDRYAPRAIIAAERTGPNSAGIRHSSTGRSAIDACLARLEFLFEEAAARGVLTIGIGDNGNELGFGVVADAVREHKPWGARCECPCGQGIACVTKAEVLMVANVSNWGAYAIEAALAFLLERPEVLHEADIERRMLEACSAAGAADGSIGVYLPWADGMPLAAQTSMVELLNTVVRNGLKARVREF